MKNKEKKEHYHGLLAPCPYSKIKTIPLLDYHGKVIAEFLEKIISCKLQRIYG